MLWNWGTGHIAVVTSLESKTSLKNDIVEELSLTPAHNVFLKSPDD